MSLAKEHRRNSKCFRQSIKELERNPRLSPFNAADILRSGVHFLCKYFLSHFVRLTGLLNFCTNFIPQVLHKNHLNTSVPIARVKIEGL